MDGGGGVLGRMDGGGGVLGRMDGGAGVLESKSIRKRREGDHDYL